MDTTAQWQQEAGFVMKANSMGEIMAANNACTNLKVSSSAAVAAAGVALDQQQKRARPQEHLNCPRCNSTNTKFCYYNNYSLTQPRYFCKTCRRYWTEGGTLRNVPVGGGSRKNKKPSTCTTISSPPPSGSSAISKNTSIGVPDLNPPTNHLYRGQDLNLAFPPLQPNTFQYMPPSSTKSENDSEVNQNHPRFASSSPLSFMTIGANGAGQAVAAPESNNMAAYSSGFSFQEFKPGVLGFVPADGLGGRFNNHRSQENGNGNGGGRILFPFGELKNGHNNGVEQHKGQGNNPTGYWSGLLGGGSW